MTLASCLAVTAIVWTISLIRSVRLRAFVYSLPIPITLVLVLTGVTVDGAQLIGVVALNLFFCVVAVLHHRYGWNILVADAAGIATYVLLGALVARVDRWPLVPTLAVVLGTWVAVNLAIVLRGKASTRSTAPSAGRSKLVKLLIALSGSLLTGLLGNLLHGLVVTFPYAGILVAVESRAVLPEFARYFARNSLGMVVYLVTYATMRGLPMGVAIAGSWAAFLLCGLALNLRNVLTTLRTAWTVARVKITAGPP